MLDLPVFKKGRSDQDKFLTLDIDSSGVKVLAFYQEDGISKIMSSVEEKYELGTVRAGVIIDPAKVEETLKTALEKVEEKTQQNIKTCLVGISGDVQIGLTTTVKATRPAPEPITKKVLDEIQVKLTEAAFLQAQEEYMQMTGDSDMDLEIVLSDTVYSKIDDQRVSDVEERIGRNIEIAIYKAFMPGFHVRQIQKVTKRVGLNLLTVIPHSYSINECIKDSALEKNDYILIDVGSDTTDVAVIFGRGIITTKTLNVGYIHFVEGISEKMGLILKESEKVLRTYSAGQLTSSEEVVVQKCITDVMNLWLNGLGLLFNEFTGVKTFPQKIYLTGIGATVPDLMVILKERPWTRSIPFKENINMTKLDFADFPKIKDATGKVKSLKWIPTMSLAQIYEKVSS